MGNSDYTQSLMPKERSNSRMNVLDSRLLGLVEGRLVRGDCFFRPKILSYGSLGDRQHKNRAVIKITEGLCAYMHYTTIRLWSVR